MTSVAEKKTRRLSQIDIIRGYCIASMIAGHLGAGTIPIHVFPAFDGASGFVLLSGLVLGIVRRRSLEGQGHNYIQAQTVKRVRVLWVATVVVSLIGIAVYAVASRSHSQLPPLADQPVWETVWRVITLQEAPPVGSVLRLYVVIFLLAFGVFWLLARGRAVMVAAASVTLYLVATQVPGPFTFVEFDDVTSGVNWGRWQLLFFTALLLGWQWRKLDVPAWLHRRRWTVGAVAIVWLIVAKVLLVHAPGFFDKLNMGPGWFVSAWAVVTLLYVVLTAVMQLVPRWVFRPAELVGTRSLDSYIIQAVIAVSVPSFMALEPGPAAAGVAVGTFLLCWLWAELRRLYNLRRNAPARSDR